MEPIPPPLSEEETAGVWRLAGSRGSSVPSFLPASDLCSLPSASGPRGQFSRDCWGSTEEDRAFPFRMPLAAHRAHSFKGVLLALSSPHKQAPKVWTKVVHESRLCHPLGNPGQGVKVLCDSTFLIYKMGIIVPTSKNSCENEMIHIESSWHDAWFTEGNQWLLSLLKGTERKPDTA